MLAFLRPDAKSQLTFRYGEDGKPLGIEAVVLSTQHDPDIAQKDLHEAVREEILKPTLPGNWVTKTTKVYINPTGKFVIGGPVGDCGLTGRKIIVDTYGGMARHGGGAFSGKDPSKVDRSAAYAARYVAKNIVAAGIADRCEIQVSYAIGVAEPSVDQREHVRYQQAVRRESAEADSRALRSAPARPHSNVEPETADLSHDRLIRPFRPHRISVHVGAYGQSRRAGRGRARRVSHGQVPTQLRVLPTED